MKTKLSLFYIIFLLGFQYSYAQETRFFMPSEIERAYENGTRSYDGQPGASYWHNAVDYKIRVDIVPSERLIDGYEEVVYHNSSPDVINELVVRLYADVYKKGNRRDAFFGQNYTNTEDIHDGVELTDVVIGDVSYDLNDQNMTQRSGTNIIFTLQKPLGPGEELTFTTSWKQKIPLSNVRTGVYDSTTFFVAYWYPQVAVYDDIFGWDKLNYTLTTEFYNNLGNYDVEINAPNDYLVWATGTLENSNEVLPNEIHDKYQKARSSTEVINIVSADDIADGFQTLEDTWHYKASEVSDFAFALSNHYLWDAAIAQVDNRQVFISSVFPIDTTGNYSDHVALQQKIMQQFSDDIPGIDYPYEAFTTFIRDGLAGMEYPMMANNGGSWRGLTMHEMFHTYFPMYVRTNERRWAWMDEGWADFITALLRSRFYDDEYDIANVFIYVSPGSTMGTIDDLPIITSSQFLEGSNYEYASYSLPATVYAIMYHHLGEDLFMEIFQEYIKRWAKKSPTPYDFFYTFENLSGQDLSWLWKPWFFEFGVADVAVGSLNKNKLAVLKKGNKPVPLFIEIRYNNGESKIITQSAGIWADGRKETKILIPDHKNVENIFVNKFMIDADLFDNVFPSAHSLYSNFDIPSNLLGLYKVESFSVDLNITMEDGIVYFKVPDDDISFIIYPEEIDYYSSFDGFWKVVFKKDDKGLYSNLDIIVNGSVYEATKQDE